MSTTSKEQAWYERERAQKVPWPFKCMASSSIDATPRFSICAMKSSALSKSRCAPQSPRRLMYAMFRGSDAPVAEQYTTRAFGSISCSSWTVAPVLLGSAPSAATAFFALWHSSKQRQPSKPAPPSQATTWSSRVCSPDEAIRDA